MAKKFKDIETGDKLYYYNNSTDEFGDYIVEVVYPFIFIRQLKPVLDISLRNNGDKSMCLVGEYCFYSDLDLFCKDVSTKITSALDEFLDAQWSSAAELKDLRKRHKFWGSKVIEFNEKYLSLNN